MGKHLTSSLWICPDNDRGSKGPSAVLHPLSTDPPAKCLPAGIQPPALSQSCVPRAGSAAAKGQRHRWESQTLGHLPSDSAGHSRSPCLARDLHLGSGCRVITAERPDCKFLTRADNKGHMHTHLSMENHPSAAPHAAHSSKTHLHRTATVMGFARDRGGTRGTTPAVPCQVLSGRPMDPMSDHCRMPARGHFAMWNGGFCHTCPGSQGLPLSSALPCSQ